MCILHVLLYLLTICTSLSFFSNQINSFRRAAVGLLFIDDDDTYIHTYIHTYILNEAQNNKSYS